MGSNGAYIALKEGTEENKSHNYEVYIYIIDYLYYTIYSHLEKFKEIILLLINLQL